MSYDRLAPTISSKAKKCLVPITWVKIVARPPVTLSDRLDTRPCKILDPRLRRRRRRRRRRTDGRTECKVGFSESAVRGGANDAVTDGGTTRREY